MLPSKNGKLHKFGAAFEQNLEKTSEGFKPHALAPQKLEVGAATLDQQVFIDVDLIDDNPYQPRLSMDETELGDLVEQINTSGQLQAGAVRPHPHRAGRYQMIFGHRRKYSVKNGYLRPQKNGPPTRVYANAGTGRARAEQYIGQLLVVVREADELEMRRQAFAENNSRVDLKPLETAKFYADTLEELTRVGRLDGTIKRDRKGQWKSATTRDLAAFLRKPLSTVSRIMQLLELPEAMQKVIESGEMNERHGRALRELAPWPDQQRALFSDLKKSGVKGTAAEREAARRLAFLRERAPRPEDEERRREEARIAREELEFDPDAERQAQLRRAEIASVMQTPEEAASLALGALEPSFAPDQTEQNTDRAPVKSGTAGVAQIPRLPGLVHDNMHSATVALEWAAKGFDVMAVALHEVEEFEAHIVIARKWMRVLEEALKRHKRGGGEL